VTPDDRSALFEKLRDLHHGDSPLVLPNTWDCASARAVAKAGFPVVATTSGGIAASLGWEDGEKTPADEMFHAIGRIASSVDVPVTADVESGYGLSSTEIVAALREVGAVGCNIEDTDHSVGNALLPVEDGARRIAEMKAATASARFDLFVNARIDVFVRGTAEGEDPVALALERAHQYSAAGADCVYPIGADVDQLTTFIQNYEGPVNGFVRPDKAPLSRLSKLGLARISYGSRLQRLTLEGFSDRLGVIRKMGDV